MVRVFVTGDEHIGLKYANHKESQKLADSRIDAINDMVRIANEEDCQLFICTGDLFESINVAKKQVEAVVDILSKFNGTVVVLPGNHDYYGDDVNVWKYFIGKAKEYDNIMLMSEYRPYHLTGFDDNIVLYPALCTSKHSNPGENNLDWIKNLGISKDDTIRIGVAHGSVDGETIDNEGRYFLMTRQELESIPVDVWLIGHTHVPFPKGLSNEYTVSDKILNPGTHVQTDVNCNTEGLCFIVEIDSDKNVRAKKVVSGNLRFFSKEVNILPGNMRDILEHELSEFPDNSVVDLILTGSASDEEYMKRYEIVGEILDRFIEGNLDDALLSRAITEELIDSEFVETSFSAKFLKSLLQDPKEAQLAYDLLSSLKQEGK